MAGNSLGIIELGWNEVSVLGSEVFEQTSAESCELRWEGDCEASPMKTFFFM